MSPLLLSVPPTQDFGFWGLKHGVCGRSQSNAGPRIGRPYSEVEETNTGFSEHRALWLQLGGRGFARESDTTKTRVVDHHQQASELSGFACDRAVTYSTAIQPPGTQSRVHRIAGSSCGVGELRDSKANGLAFETHSLLPRPLPSKRYCCVLSI